MKIWWKIAVKQDVTFLLQTGAAGLKNGQRNNLNFLSIHIIIKISNFYFDAELVSNFDARPFLTHSIIFKPPYLVFWSKFVDILNKINSNFSFRWNKVGFFRLKTFLKFIIIYSWNQVTLNLILNFFC